MGRVRFPNPRVHGQEPYDTSCLFLAGSGDQPSSPAWTVDAVRPPLGLAELHKTRPAHLGGHRELLGARPFFLEAKEF